MKTYKDISRKEFMIDMLFLLQVHYGFSDDKLDELVKRLEDWEKVEYPKEWFEKGRMMPQ